MLQRRIFRLLHALNYSEHFWLFVFSVVPTMSDSVPRISISTAES